MTVENIKLTAREGCVLRRISDSKLFGNELYLGITYYEYGCKLEYPFPELPEHYEEIEDISIED